MGRVLAPDPLRLLRRLRRGHRDRGV